jgi:hypothetical protein
MAARLAGERHHTALASFAEALTGASRDLLFPESGSLVPVVQWGKLSRHHAPPFSIG